MDKFTFGMYKGKDVDTIIEVNPKYVLWAPYICIGARYTYCIPYEGNEHLLGVKFRPEHIVKA